MAALDTVDKRHAIMTQVGRLQFGLVANGTVSMDDCQNYAWIYPFLTYPPPAEVGGIGIPWIKKTRANRRRKLYGQR